MENKISASEAARNLSDIINRVRYKGEEFIVERGGLPVCRIVPTLPAHSTGAELAKFFENVPKPDPEFWDIVADAVRRQPMLPESPWSR